ncbi:hypothetical protein Goshw_027842 [Gossypium schwendimanii]|uniref:Uncharacterized protein n=1 Tax=Gossypium schwendimanii TaxID=34291 RepID=A0A7J9M7R8_GOSSC|nr:hypothetical protein [Gossypium schwendimanii]
MHPTEIFDQSEYVRRECVVDSVRDGENPRIRLSDAARDIHKEYINAWDRKVEFLPIREPFFSLDTVACLEYMQWFRVIGKSYMLSMEARSRTALHSSTKEGDGDKDEVEGGDEYEDEDDSGDEDELESEADMELVKDVALLSQQYEVKDPCRGEDFSDPNVDNVLDDIDEERVDDENDYAPSVRNLSHGIVIRNDLGAHMSIINPDVTHAFKILEYPDIIPAHLMLVDSELKNLFVG